MTSPLAPPTLGRGQLFHLAALAGLLGLVAWGWRWLGGPEPIAFWVALAVPIVHQLYVWLTWRLELTSGWTSRALGFGPYVVMFFLLLGGRVVALTWLAWLDRGSLETPLLLRWVMAAVLIGFGMATNYSVARYFGWKRAAGADHFFARYREMPFVRQGIFRLTPNAMYVFGFMLLWGIALAFASSAALVVAAFNHAYIWVHYLATERPDMQYLYAGRQVEDQPS